MTWAWTGGLKIKNTGPRVEILVGRRSGPDRETCGPDRVICLAPDL